MNIRHAAYLAAAFVAGIGTAVGLAPAFAPPITTQSEPTPIPITPAEHEALTKADATERWLDEEILFREGLRRGFAMDDLIVRRQLQRRTRLALLEAEPAAPVDDTRLQAYLDAHAERYQASTRRGFDQVFLSRSTHGAQLDAQAARIGERLRAQPERYATLGDAFAGGSTRMAASEAEIVADFGGAFVQALAALPVGEWRGPIATPLGAHWVRITRIEPARTLSLTEARHAVRADFEAEDERQRLRRALDALRGGYRVVVDAAAVRAEFKSQDDHGDH